EELLMIETNARNDRDVLLHNVRRIEPPAEADFENRKAHSVTEIEKSHSCDQLEIRRRVKEILCRASRIFHFGKYTLQFVIRNFLCSDAYPLVQPHEMR